VDYPVETIDPMDRDRIVARSLSPGQARTTIAEAA
jgi:hypothetical protein